MASDCNGSLWPLLKALNHVVSIPNYESSSLSSPVSQKAVEVHLIFKERESSGFKQFDLGLSDVPCQLKTEILI